MPPAPQQSTPLNYGALNLSTPGAVSPASAAKSTFVNNLAQKTGASTPAAPTTPATPQTQYNYNNGVATPVGTPVAPTPTPTDTSASDQAFATYLKSLTASPDTKAANDYLNNLISQQNNENEFVDEHPGETTGFANAAKERINANAANSISAATRALSTLDSRDQTVTAASKARLDYEQTKLSNATQAAKDAASAAVAAQNEKPASAKEYEYAKTQGYTGTYEQYQNEDANRKAKASGTSQTATNAAQADDVAGAVVDFQNQMTQKGWAGANPDAYDYYRAQLTALYGASAALALDAAMKTAGIVVDRKNK